MVHLLTPPAIAASAVPTPAPRPGRTRGRLRSRELVVTLGSAVVMLATGLWGLDRGSMWQDEQVTVEVAHRSPGQIVAMLSNVDVVHGLYYCFMHGWMLAGHGEVWARVPSVLAMAVAGGVVAGLGVRLSGVRVGLLAGLLFAASPLVSFYAQEARSYALVCAAVVVATLSLVQALATGSRRWWVAYAGLMLVAVVLHEFAVLVLLAHATTLILVRARAGFWFRWLGVALLCVAAVTPLAVISQRQSGALDWMRPPTAATVLDLVHQLLGASWWTLVPMTVLVGIGTIAAFRGRAIGKGEGLYSSRPPGLGDVALPLIAVPPAVLLAASVVEPLFQLRYVAYSEAGVVVMAALGTEVLATRLARAFRRPVLASLLAAAMVAGLFASQLPAQHFERTPDSRLNDLAAAADVVRLAARPGDAVVFMPKRFRSVALAYPDAFADVDDIALNRSPARARNVRGIDHGRRTVEGAMLGRERIWAIGQPGLRLESDQTDALNEQAVLRQHFRRERVVHVHGMDVALFVRSG